MSSRAKKQTKYKNKIVLASLTAGVLIAAVKPGIQAKVEAAVAQYEWTKQEAINPAGGDYISSAISANGNSLILSTVEGGEGTDDVLSPLYISNNYGTSWENVAETIDDGVRHWWTSVDVSNDGQTMVASSDWAIDLGNAFIEGKVFVSEDAGDTWDEVTPTSDDGDNWRQVVVSGDGSKIAAIEHGNADIFVSTNDGTSWTSVPADDMNHVDSISISDNGNKLLVGGENSEYSIANHISNDAGDTWEDISPNPEDGVSYTVHDMSADGNKIVIATQGWDGGQNDGVFVSTNGGSNWSDNLDPNDDIDNVWADATISDDGSVISTLDRYGNMHISDDSGANWSEQDPGAEYEDENEWRSLDTNSDGSKFIVNGIDNVYLNTGEAPSNPDPESNPTTASLNNAEGGKKIIITTPSGTTITCSSSVKESGLDVKDGAYQYPLGLVDFCFSGADEDNEVSLLFVTDLKPNEVAVRKYNPNDNSYANIGEASVTETTYEGDHALLVSYNIVDNGPLDLDPDDGEVADPVGLATLEVGAPDTGIAPTEQITNVAKISVLTTAALAAGVAANPIRKRLSIRIAFKK